MSCLHLGSFDPGRGRPLVRPVARPLAWCGMSQNCRWTPVASRIVARTYLSLLTHLFSTSTDGSPARPRPLPDGVRQAGQGRFLQFGDFDRPDLPGLEMGVTGVDRPILWPNCLIPTPSSFSLLVWKECRTGVIR
jgi:hypothetical protein